MPFIVTMPKLSPTQEEGVIVRWNKKEGDFVKEQELLIEVSTDKATVEYQALDKGYLRKILVAGGSSAKINDPIAVFSETKEEDISSFLNTLSSKKEKSVEKPEKEKKEAPQEKVVTEAPLAGSTAKPFFTPPTLRALDKTEVKVSPRAKKMAEEAGIDLASIKGTGPNQRIVAEDLLQGASLNETFFSSRGEPKLPSGSYEEKKISPIQKVVGERLSQSKTFIPHFYLSMAIDAEPLFQVRERLKAMGISYTYNDFVIKAVSYMLREHSFLNCGFNPENQTLLQFQTVDIAVAVAAKEGLYTPIIWQADYKSIGEISKTMKVLSEKTKQGKLKPEEYQGGSFTVSNLGMYGIPSFQAIINPPQGAILAVGALEEVPVVKEGTVVAGKKITFTLSLDHRVTDGKGGAVALNTLKKLLEHPEVLLLG